MMHRRKAKASKNTAKNTFKVLEEVNFIVELAPFFIVIKQPKDLQTFILNIIVYVDTTKQYHKAIQQCLSYAV